MTGKNAALREVLANVDREYSDRLRVIGFTEDVASLMMAADLAITKPGGLSTSECLVCGLPMLLVNPIPGQEERNAAFLMQEGVAQRADDPLTLQFRLQKLLSDPERLASMRQRAMALGKPQAAQQVLGHVA
jgi:processive 1,2-diacylglycerol beta-glucosyltransferase